MLGASKRAAGYRRLAHKLTMAVVTTVLLCGANPQISYWISDILPERSGADLLRNLANLRTAVMTYSSSLMRVLLESKVKP